MFRIIFWLSILLSIFLNIFVSISHIGLWNFHPIVPIVFLGAYCLNKSNIQSILLPWIVLFSELVITFISDANIGWFLIRMSFYLVLYLVFTRYFTKSGIKNLSLTRLGIFTFSNSLLFYLFTNTISFFTDGIYTKNIYGWIQSLTIGEPGYPATIFFFTNSVVGDLIFTYTITLLYEYVRNKKIVYSIRPLEV